MHENAHRRFKLWRSPSRMHIYQRTDRHDYPRWGDVLVRCGGGSDACTQHRE